MLLSFQAAAEQQQQAAQQQQQAATAATQQQLAAAQRAVTQVGTAAAVATGQVATTTVVATTTTPQPQMAIVQGQQLTPVTAATTTVLVCSFIESVQLSFSGWLKLVILYEAQVLKISVIQCDFRALPRIDSRRSAVDRILPFLLRRMCESNHSFEKRKGKMRLTPDLRTPYISLSSHIIWFTKMNPD